MARRLPHRFGVALAALTVLACAPTPGPPPQPLIPVELPKVAGNAELAPRAPFLWVSPTQLALEHPTAEGAVPGEILPAGESEGLMIPSLTEALQTRLPQGGRPVLNVMIDARTSYARVVKVVYTAHQAGWTEPRFGIEDPLHSAVIMAPAAKAISAAESEGCGPPAIQLGVTVLGHDLVLRASSTDLQALLGCPSGRTEGCTIAGGSLAALAAHAGTLKARFPEAFETFVASDGPASWGRILQVLAALRGPPEQPLFPTQSLSVAL